MPKLTLDQALEQAVAFRQVGRTGQAKAICREILVQHRAQPQAMGLLAAMLATEGQYDEALPLLRRLYGLQPTDERIALLLASALRRVGRLEEAVSILRAANDRQPENAALFHELGLVERARGNLSAAVDSMRRAVQLQPDFVEARNNLGLTLTEAGEPQAAADHFAIALRLAPTVAALHYNLGLAVDALGRHEEAAAAYRRATELNPRYAEAFVNLGATLKVTGQLDEAVAALEQALRLQPSWAAVHSHLAGIYEWQARHDDALASHRRAMELAPDDARLHGNSLFTLIFHPRFDAAALRAAHEAWGHLHAQSIVALPAPVDRDRTPGRRLRVGYVCGSFRDHVLGRYLMPLLRCHDRAAVEVFCYSNNRSDDAATPQFRALADGWRDIVRLSDDAAAALVRADGIDLLVDTTLHMADNRLLVFARRPAPVQLTMAGYPGTTGLPAIDWRLTDMHLDPPGQHDADYVERSLRLPDTFWCYDPLGDDQTVGPLPADARGFVTFGCLNNFSKVNDDVIALWARVLRAVEGSRLHVLCHQGSHRDRALRSLHALRVDPNRVDFFAYRPRRDYLGLYRGIDISLDTVPYNGHTTSLDSLWMGVPVVTLVGHTVVGRAGKSQLTNLGLPELIAWTPEQYEAIVRDLAADRDRLRRMRGELRHRMECSPLMDARRFARNVETAFRNAWADWCDRPASRRAGTSNGRSD